ncbi:MAG: hypothetical protein LBJ40_00755, partial [Delftia acidovorans]|nr:hypothetical protein [Delftia acidovorans]
MRFHPPSVPRRRRSKPALAACLLWASAGLVHAVPGPSQGPAHHRAHAPAHAPAQGSAQVRQIQRAQQALQVLPVPFEANSGQFDAAVAFAGRTFAGAVHVTRQGQIVYSLPGAAPASGTPPDQATPRPNPRPTPDPQPAPAAGWSLTETLAGALPLSPRGGEA